MRAVFSRIHLSNDDTQIDRPQFYIKKKWRGREQDSRETERERECVRDCKWRKGEDSVGHKTCRWRNTSSEIKCGINSRY